MARILIIDDNEIMRKLLCEILTSAGHEVVEASNGKEGLRLHRQAPADLVITDVVMPEEDGLETIRTLHAEDPAVRIIVMTGYDPDGKMGYLSLAENYGASRTLNKPLTSDEILEAVKASLEG